uniref:Uncharacterized protein n=1 Tax=Oncorhynchus tshawytscha TaxID=74940 RepID=A0A8C8M6X9_ONCTS
MALYVKTAEIIEKVERKQATQKFSSILHEIIESTKTLPQHHGWSLTSCLVLSITQVLVYDLVVGKGLQCGGAWKALMMKHRSRLQAALAGMKIRQKVSCNQDLLSSSLQQYVRVNILKTTVEDAIDYLKREVFHLPGTGLQRDILCGDLQLSDLLVVSAKTDFHDHNLYKAGHIILQDKVWILNPCPGSCTAPENKTNHLAAIMNNKGKRFAFDLDAKHLSTMSTLLLCTRITCQQLAIQDILKVDRDGPQYRSKLVYLCVSLSGMVCLQDETPASQKEHDSPRLKALAVFQLHCLNHARHFLRLNEQVVAACLQQNPGFRLVPLLQQWPECSSTTKALTHSFFVVLLERQTAQSLEQPASQTL